MKIPCRANERSRLLSILSYKVKGRCKLLELGFFSGILLIVIVSGSIMVRQATVVVLGQGQATCVHGKLPTVTLRTVVSSLRLP